MGQKNQEDQHTDVAGLDLEKMTAADARRIQSHADRTGTNQDFKRRAMRAAARNKKKG